MQEINQDGKLFFTADQGKTTASNGLDSLISQGPVISFFFFFYFFILFDAHTKQDDPKENKWKFDYSILSFFSLSYATYLQPVNHLYRSHWHSPPCSLFLFLEMGKGAILLPHSPLLLFTGLWPRVGVWGASSLTQNQWLSDAFRSAVCLPHWKFLLFSFFVK